MTDKHICDCGQLYSHLSAMQACQARNHAGYGEAEVADANQSARYCGVDPGPPGTEELRFDPRGNLTVTNATILRGFQPGDVVFIENNRELSADDARRAHEVLERFSQRTGVKCLLLAPGMKAVGKKPGEGSTDE